MSSDDDKVLARCPFCGHEQEKIAALTNGLELPEPPENMRICKCQNPKCGRVFFTSDE